MFRLKKSIPLGYDEQGYIYFTSRRYKQLPAEQKRAIRDLCAVAGGEYEEALFSFVTTDQGADAICARYFLSPSTLERIVRKYYIAFSDYDFA